jgi:hypothetical protein
MKDKAPLRFVILCDSLDFPKWQADCVREVISYGLAVPVGIVLNTSNGQSQNSTSWIARWHKRDYALWRLFNKLYVDRFSKSTVTNDMTSYFQTVSKFHDEPVKIGKFSNALSDKALDFIQQSHPHFLLRFGFGILKGAILRAAPYGVWSYHHGDPSSFRGQPPGFWEIYNGSAVTGSVLQVLSEELDAGITLHKGFFQTVAHSYVKTRDSIYRGSSSWVRRTCAAIKEDGWPIRASDEPMCKGPICKQPTNMQMGRFLAKTVRNFLRNQVTYRLFRQGWTLGVVTAPIQTVAGLDGPEEQTRALETTVWMSRSPHCFFADPFGYESTEGATIKILFERFDIRRKIGSIASTCYKNGTFDSAKVILDSATHLSYPYVMKSGDEIYCMPEHSAARNISAFRLTEANHVDRKISILPQSELVDATIVFWNDRYWLFGIDESKSKNTELHLYYGKKWEGPWLAHPLNPVKSDVQNSRPGGTPFVHNGKLYRPAQDCSNYYGSAVVINEITSLDEACFEERSVARVEPWRGSKYQYGLHTLSAVGQFTLIDGATKESVFR